jgi:RNA polymerase sigma-70 factor (ECF subfamily)
VSEVTCWTVIRGAAQGNRCDREAFAQRYVPVVRAYLGARWRHDTLSAEIDDALQEVFVECFRSGGVLDRVDSQHPGGFRAFFHGVIRNVARRFETRRARRKEQQPSSSMADGRVASDEAGLSSVFDRAWALSILEQAVERHRVNAEAQGETGERRIELLRLRFEEDLPVREIARLWETDPASVHKEYARARRDFRNALAEVVAFHHPGAHERVEVECSRLLALFK